MLLSSDAETDANLIEASELSISTSCAIGRSSDKSALQQDRVSLQEFAMISKRFEVSEKVGAAIGSAH